MNRIYRVVWNTSRRLWQVACELGCRQKKTHRKLLSVITAGSLLLVSVDALATLPTGGSVVAGSGSISQTSQDMTVNQTSQNMVVNWNSFSIGKDNSVTFVQPNSSSAVLNRVTGDSVSEIRGMLSSNGRVFLVNPNGVVFSSTAQVDVGALVASTQDISNSDFMSGNYTFSGTSDNAVINNGNIVTSEGGVVALIAAKIVNTGNITTTEGATLMGAGTTVTLDLGGTVDISVSKSLYETYIKNGGVIQADGGLIYLTAKAADALTSSVINNTGVLQAQTLGTDDTGEIVLMGDLDSGSVTVSGTIDASAPNGGDGGSIETSAASVNIGDDATITTASTYGETGSWLIDPTDFTIVGGSATGTASGIGADTLSDLLESNNVTIETSSTNTDNESGDINVDADVSWDADSTLTLDAYGDININADITASGDSAGLVLNYGGYYQNNGSVSTDSDYTFGDDGSVTLSGENATLSINGTSYTLIHDVSELTALNGKSGYYALAGDLTLSTSYTDAVISEFSGTLAGLGNTISNLTIKNTSDASNLGLIGTLDSSGTIRDIHLSDVDIEGSTTSSHYVGGLVGSSRGTITGSSVSGSVSGAYYVGGLAGKNYRGGSIANSYASATVTGAIFDAGGLVGQSYGSITSSYATGDVTGKDCVGGLAGYTGGDTTDSYATGDVTGSGEYVGGLLGEGNGAITNSYATGDVTGDTSVGGLLGEGNSSETIRDSYATGEVNGSGNYVGGLVGKNLAGSESITDSFYATTNSDGKSIDDAYTDTDGTGVTYADLTQLSTFTDDEWDISSDADDDSVWYIADDSTSTPTLRAFTDDSSSLPTTFPATSSIDVDDVIILDPLNQGSSTPTTTTPIVTTGPSDTDSRQVDATRTALEQTSTNELTNSLMPTQTQNNSEAAAEIGNGTSSADSTLNVAYVDSVKGIASSSNVNAELYVVDGGIQLASLLDNSGTSSTALSNKQ